VSHLDLKANPGANQMCARIKSHTYDDSWYRNECHIFISVGVSRPGGPWTDE
jgi:hypothetical protein